MAVATETRPALQYPRLNSQSDSLVPLSSPNDTFQKFLDGKTRQVHVTSSLTLGDYRRITPGKDMFLVQELAGQINGEWTTIGATANGGGVALMRAPQTWLMGELGVAARWHVLTSSYEAFDITKRNFHNTLQGVANAKLTPEKREAYNAWIEENSRLMVSHMRNTGLFVIDDAQPHGLIPYLKEAVPEAKIMARIHIDLSHQVNVPGTAQHEAWEFIMGNGLRYADLFIFHPGQRIPDNVQKERVVFMPPSTDPLDDLNRKLTDREIEVGKDFIAEGLRANESQEPIDLSRPLISQLARFDPSKGINLALDSYVLLRRKMTALGIPLEETPQLLIAGNGATDDPDGQLLLDQTMTQRSQMDPEIMKDVKVVRISHNDRALNAMLRLSTIVLQLSTAEGFEFKIIEAAEMGKPVIVNNVGGMPLQVEHGVTGYVVRPGDTEAVSGHLLSLLQEREAYDEMSREARRFAQDKGREFTTVPNVINLLYLGVQLQRNPDFRGNGRYVRDILSGLPTAA